MQVSRFVGLAAGVALVFGVSATASAQAGGARGKRQGAVQADSTRGPRGDRGGQPGIAGRALLRDITLTPEQKTRVDAIQAKYAEQLKAARQGRPGAGANGANGVAARRERPDSATMAKLRAEREQAMAQVTGELRAVLTADQQVVFDRNVATMKERGSATKARGGRNGRGAPSSGR